MKYDESMRPFYDSLEWKRCRETYKRMKGYVCERCGNTSKKMIVHHKIHLTPFTMNDPDISLNYDNLELLCMDCHNREHFKHEYVKRYEIGENGEIIMIE